MVGRMGRERPRENTHLYPKSSTEDGGEKAAQ